MNMNPHAVIIKANARVAREFSIRLSPSRNFEPEGRRGHYIINCADEVQALRDAEWLRDNGATVVAEF